MPPTSRLKILSMVSTRRLSSHKPQASTLLASPIKLLVLMHQINNLTISRTSQRTARTKPTKLEAFLIQLLTSHLFSHATTVGAVTTGLRIVQSHEELYLRKMSSSLYIQISANTSTRSGALNGSRPLKKQKTTGPIITRYPPPPNHSSPPSLQRGFTHPPVGRQAFPAPHGPLTPLSANGQSYNSWRPQQHPFVSQGPRQSSQQWTSPSMPTPTSSYGPQYASPVSMNGSTQHQNYFNSQSQAPANQTSPSANPTPLHASSTVESSNYQKQYLNSSRRESVSSDRNQASETNSENVEPWLEELQALDFTEGKVGSGLISTHLMTFHEPLH